MKRLRLSVLLSSIGFLIVLGSTFEFGTTLAVAQAATSVPSQPVSLTLSINRGAGPHSPLIISVDSLSVRSNDTTPGLMIHFYVTTKLFGGKHLVPIGTTQFSSSPASVTYYPTWSGLQTFTATLTDASSTQVEGSTSTFYNVTYSKPGTSYLNANPKKPLSDFGRYFVVALLVIVGAIWMTLIATIVRVTRGVDKLSIS